MKGILSTIDLDDASLVAKAKASPGLVGRDLAREVMPRESASWDLGLNTSYPLRIGSDRRRAVQGHDSLADATARPHVVALDFGMKWNILRHLVDIGCKVTVMPGSTPAEAILDASPTESSSQTGPAIPAPLSERDGHLADPDPYGGRVPRDPDLRDLSGPSAPGPGLRRGRPSSSSSAIAGPTTRCATKQRARSRSRPRITASPSIPSSLPADVMPSHVNLNDQTLEGLRHRTIACFQRAVPPRGHPPARTTACISSTNSAA